MNGLDKIVNRINEDCDAAVSSVIAEAEAKAAAIMAKAQAEAEEERDSLIKAAEQKAEEMVRMAESSAALARRRRILTERVAIMDGVIAHAVENYVSGDAEEYFEGMKKLAVKYILPGEQKMVFSDADVERMPAGFEADVNAKVGAGSHVSVCGGGKFSGGFMLIGDEMVENCTLAALVGDKEAELRDDLSKLLFS